jgi:hypothetical protein
MKKIFSILLLSVCVEMSSHAQLSFYFQPEIYGRSIDGLGSFQVQNRGLQKMVGRIGITVRENRTGSPVVNILTPEQVFNPGLNSFSKVAFNRSAFNFSLNGYGAISGQTRNLPPGDYTFCFKFTPTDKSVADEYEDCFDAEIEPLVPLSLLNPYHLDTICNKRPLLTWQPPIPFSSSMKFRLLLTEKTGDDAGVEDLLLKTPLLLLDNISSSSVNYPSTKPELKEGKTYYWQVIAHEKGLIVSRSEIWEFTVRCKEPVRPSPADSYRELKLLMNGNYYIANRAIRFSFKNEYNINKLKYSILHLSEGGEALKNLPEVKLQQGFNKIQIDLDDLDLKVGSHYLLRVYPFNEPPVDVRFVYEDNDNGL